MDALSKIRAVDKEFFDDLDVFVKARHTEVMTALKSVKCFVHHIEYKVNVTPEFLEKFKLNSDLTFYVIFDASQAKIEYCYKDVPVKPDCHYIPPNNYVRVPTLYCMQEAIAQDSCTPDIKPMELTLAQMNTPDNSIENVTEP